MFVLSGHPEAHCLIEILSLVWPFSQVRVVKFVGSYNVPFCSPAKGFRESDREILQRNVLPLAIYF